MKPTDGAKKSVDAALATLAPLSDQDVAGTRVELVSKSQLSSGGKLSKALAAKIQRDRRQGLRDRLDQEAERLKALKKARKEREKRKSRGDILDDDSGTDFGSTSSSSELSIGPLDCNKTTIMVRNVPFKYSMGRLFISTFILILILTLTLTLTLILILILILTLTVL